MSWWRTHTWLRLAIKTALFTVLALALIFALGIAYLASPAFNKKASNWASHASGRQISLEHFRLHMGREPRVVLEGLNIGNANWSKDPALLHVERIEFSLRLSELLHFRLAMPELTFVHPKLVLEKNADGAANWDFTQNPKAKLVTAPVPQTRYHMPLIGHLHIDDGTLTYRDPAKHIDTTLNISTATGESDRDESIKLLGKGTYMNKPFSLDMTGGSILFLRDSTKPYPFSVKAVIGPTTAQMEGKVQDPLTLEALDITLELGGANAADLFPLTGIALPPTPAYKVTGHLTHAKDEWHFSDFVGHLGGSDLAGDLYWYAAKKPPLFKAAFVSNNLDMKDLAGFIGADRKPVNDNRLIPDEQIDISRLMAMDADVTLKGKSIKTAQVLDNFSMDLILRDGTLVLKPVTFGMAKGTISADVSIEGRKNPPLVNADVRFSRLSLYHLFRPLMRRFGRENVSVGLLGGKAALTGSGKSLRSILATSHGEIGMGMEGGTLSRLLLEIIGLDIFKTAGLLLTGQDEPVPIRCVVGDFGVKDGIMQTQVFIINTKVTTIDGKGSINLQNEKLDLTLHVHPKDATLVSARAPILIHGTLKHPSVGVDAASLAARGGAAAALGALLTPVGALLAFIEPGLGEKSNCAAFVRELNSRTGGAIPKNPTPAK